MSDWNPKDPEALTTRYDLSDWSVDDRADVAAALADAEIAHSWDGSELLVAQDTEQVVDAILDEIEDELDNLEDGDDDSGEDNITEYELDEWSEGERKQLCDMLDKARCFDIVFDSICRIRSRVTPNSSPIWSRVFCTPSPRPNRLLITPASRG